MLLKKKLVLVVGHSSWWKRNKHRKESTIILKKHKSRGWRLKKVEKIDKDKTLIETRDFKKYFLLKEK